MSLPVHANGEAGTYTQRPSWTTAYYVRLPWPLSSRFGARHVTIYLPRHLVRLDRSPRLRKWVLAILLALAFYIFYLLFISGGTRLVFSHDELRRIWEWEVASGHYQSSRSIPSNIKLDSPLSNPGIPANHLHSSTVGFGLPRKYIDMQNLSSNPAYPPRPQAGSIADLDMIMDHCDFDSKKYVRDCLEYLKIGAGLDNGRRIRRGKMDEWKYIYVEDGPRLTNPKSPTIPHPSAPTSDTLEPPLHLSPLRTYRVSSELASACDPDHRRIFHIFWGGPFTSHPYTMLLSFLYTQNLDLHLPSVSRDRKTCRPEFWVWMQVGPAREANPKPNALELMHEELKSNPWSSPFLHPRFKDIIKFQLWNTTDQLDNTPELKNEWRSLNLFKSGKRVFHVPSENGKNSSSGWLSWLTASDVMNRMGSSSSGSYDRMRTILSDLARFVLCHRYGGIYLDADTMFLRDWEELWGWKGAFAYRWSRLHRYNTAVLKLNQGSALGSFLLRTALRHSLDFHPMDGVTQYIRDAQMENLLVRLPDALFDSAWLTVERYQRDRPPSPEIKIFEDFFETSAQTAGFVQSVGAEGFFRGAYSYHWHNSWWLPFDASRNWPDLGSRFADAERAGRLKVLGSPSPDDDVLLKLGWEDKILEDRLDLDWSTLMKRTFEAYIRGERPNMYGEWLHW